MGNDGINGTDLVGLEGNGHFTITPSTRDVDIIAPGAIGGVLPETMTGFEVDYQADSGSDCDHIMLVQAVGHSFSWSRNIGLSPNSWRTGHPELDTAGNLESPAVLDTPHPIKGSGSALSYFDAPYDPAGDVKTFHFEVCALCIKCECLAKDGKIEIWGNTKILGCTRFDWDTKRKTFEMKQDPGTFQRDGNLESVRAAAYATPTNLYQNGKSFWHHQGAKYNWEDHWCKKNHDFANDDGTQR